MVLKVKHPFSTSKPRFSGFAGLGRNYSCRHSGAVSRESVWYSRISVPTFPARCFVKALINFLLDATFSSHQPLQMLTTPVNFFGKAYWSQFARSSVAASKSAYWSNDLRCAFPWLKMNVTEHKNSEADNWPWAKIVLIVLFSLLIITTIIGNTLVILSVITTRRLRTVTNLFVMSLAVADWLVGIFVMPPAVLVFSVGECRDDIQEECFSLTRKEQLC